MSLFVFYDWLIVLPNTTLHVHTGRSVTENVIQMLY